MLRTITSIKNRTYNHGRKVGLGRLVLECGHEVSYLMARNPVVGKRAWCSRCTRDMHAGGGGRCGCAFTSVRCMLVCGHSGPHRNGLAMWTTEEDEEKGSGA